ncbi:hypothetical protein [Bradyrhizobium sp. SSUT77]|uniref:hypothetical protein n=1 Tax=Bradyrhizobium sp. SSUT77 TaxID=3040603 RepID=UPI002449FC9F|nr:hypothetical protein [Bradyrhizobium sp. SSUT77]MDH2348920.1 hypothetical protein [Bradyrhizobium sp. SSUT77]
MYNKAQERPQDPDRRVQEAIKLLFDKVEELGSARQALCWLHEYNLDLPVKQTNGDTARRRSLRTRSTAAPMPMVRISVMVSGDFTRW